MKRFFLFVCICLVGLNSAFAALPQDGSTRGTAISFDWENGHHQTASVAGVSKWYKLHVDDLLGLHQPALALYMTNLSQTQSVRIKAVVYPEVGNASLTDWAFTLSAGQFRIESEDFSMLRLMGYENVYILLTTSQSDAEVVFSAKQYEWDRVKDERGCQTLWSQFIGETPVVVPATSKYHWFTFPITDEMHQKNVYFRIENRSSAEAEFAGYVSYDCPCTGKTPFSLTIAAGQADSVLMPINVLSAIDEDNAYININTTANMAVSVVSYDGTKTAEPLPSATPYVWGQVMPVATSGEQWFTVECDSLTQMLSVPMINLSATGGAAVATRMAYVSQGQLIELARYDWSFADDDTTFMLDVNELMALPADYRRTGVIYFGLTSAQDLGFAINTASTTHASECLSAEEFDYVNGNYIEAGEPKWIHVDLANALTMHKLIQVHCTNLDHSQLSHIRAELTFECPYKEYYTFTTTLDPNETSPEVGSKDGIIPFEMYGEADEFWIRMDADTRIHIWVEMFEDPAVRVDIPEYEEFELNKWYNVPARDLVAGGKWLHYPIGQLVDTTRYPADAAPQVEIINPHGEKVQVYTTAAFHNPIDYTPVKFDAKLDGGEHIVRRVIRDIMDHYLGRYSDIYFNVNARYDALQEAVAADDSVRYIIHMVYPRRYVYDTVYITPCEADVITVEDELYGGFEPFDFYGTDTLFTQTYRFHDDTTSIGDSIRTYAVHVMHMAELPQPLTSAQIPALAIEPGATLDADWREQVEEQLWPLLDMPYVSKPDQSTVVWDYMDLDDDYTTDACADTLPMYVRLSYIDECDNLIRDTFEVAFGRHLPHIEIIDTVRITTCANSLVEDTRYGGFDPFMLSSDNLDITFTYHYAFSNGELCGDSARTYIIKGVETPAIIQPLTGDELPALAIEPGDILGDTWRDQVVLEYFNYIAGEHTPGYDPTSVQWNYHDVPMDYQTDACADNEPIDITMNYQDDCGIWHYVKMVVSFRHEGHSVIITDRIDMVACPGETVSDPENADFISFIMPAQDTVVTTHTAFHESLICGDSIRIYTIRARQAEYLETEYDTICVGQRYVWHGMSYTETGLYYDTLRYEAGCDSVIASLHLEVSAEYFRVNDDYTQTAEIHIPAYLKYGGSMLMLDLLQFNQNLAAAGMEQLRDSSLVDWYRVHGVPDQLMVNGQVSPTAGDQADQLLGHGYYMPLAGAVGQVDDYYATIHLGDNREACGVVYRTVRLTSAAEATVMLLPGSANQGETVRVVGREGQETDLAIYTALGSLVYRQHVAQDAECEFSTAPMVSGYYIVEVKVGDSRNALRLVVK